MFQSSKKDKRIYGIVGLGRFGYALAKELGAAGADFIVVDKNEEKISELREYTESAFVVKNIDKKTLSETGINNCDVAVVCIGEQIDTSILTTLMLKNFGIPTVISKATSLEHGEILEKLGAEVVYPERDMAVRLAHRLEASRVLDYIQLSETLNISKLVVPECMIGKTVQESDIRGRLGVNIIAIENGGFLIELVAPNYEFKKDDILYVCGRKEGLDWLTNLQ